MKAVLTALLLATTVACSAAPAPTGAPDTTPSASASPTVAPERPRLTDLPEGAPPRTAYVADHVWIDPDGTRRPVRARHGISGVAAFRGGFLVSDTRWFEGSVGLARVDADGEVVRTWATGGSAVSAPDGRVGWTQVTVSEADRPGPTRVYVAQPDGEVASMTVRPGTIVPLGFSGPDLVFARQWGAGLFRTDLVSPAERIGWTPRRPGPVSPEGRRLAVSTPTGVAVRALGSGAVLHRLPLPPGFLTSLGWEDEDHLLVVVHHRDRAAVVRVGLDGSLERVTPLVASVGAEPPYVLAG